MAKKKKSAVRTGALAWRINLSGVLKLFMLFLAMDIFLIWFDLSTGVIAPVDLSSVNGFIQTFKTIIISLKYSILLRAEGVVLLAKLVFGSISIRRTLKPIDELTNVAIELGSEGSDFDEEKFLQLEAAIDEISPTAENARLRFLPSADALRFGCFP